MQQDISKKLDELEKKIDAKWAKKLVEHEKAMMQQILKPQTYGQENEFNGRLEKWYKPIEKKLADEFKSMGQGGKETGKMFAEMESMVNKRFEKLEKEIAALKAQMK